MSARTIKKTATQFSYFPISTPLSNAHTGALLAIVIVAISATAISAQGNVCANVAQFPFNVRNPRSCTSFTMCLSPDHGIPRECAPNMEFSVQRNDCDLRSRANCVVAAPPVVPDPEEQTDPDNPCSSRVNFEVIALTASCNQYIVCACGTPNVQTCGAGLIFDSRTLTCNVATAAVCVSAAAARPTACPRNVAQLPHPNDCKHFFLCLGMGSTPILRQCAPRLNFNRRTNQCDHVACVVPPAPPATASRQTFQAVNLIETPPFEDNNDARLAVESVEEHHRFYDSNYEQ